MPKVMLTAAHPRFPETDCDVLRNRENLLTITDLKITGDCWLIARLSKADGHMRTSLLANDETYKEIPIMESFNGLFFEIGFYKNKKDEIAMVEFFYSVVVL